MSAKHQMMKITLTDDEGTLLCSPLEITREQFERAKCSALDALTLLSWLNPEYEED